MSSIAAFGLPWSQSVSQQARTAPSTAHSSADQRSDRISSRSAWACFSMPTIIRPKPLVDWIRQTAQALEPQKKSPVVGSAFRANHERRRSTSSDGRIIGVPESPPLKRIRKLDRPRLRHTRCHHGHPYSDHDRQPPNRPAILHHRTAPSEIPSPCCAARLRGQSRRKKPRPRRGSQKLPRWGREQVPCGMRGFGHWTSRLGVGANGTPLRLVLP
jgi:hypothetical protein